LGKGRGCGAQRLGGCYGAENTREVYPEFREEVRGKPKYKQRNEQTIPKIKRGAFCKRVIKRPPRRTLTRIKEKGYFAKGGTRDITGKKCDFQASDGTTIEGVHAMRGGKKECAHSQCLPGKQLRAIVEARISAPPAECF